MLRDLIERHRGAFEYDWRTRFRKPLSIVGTRKMSWGEAWRLVEILSMDPSSYVAAAVHEWKSPVSREWLVLADLWDAQAVQSYQKPKPYPRPFGDPAATRRGRTRKTRAEVIAILNAHGHEIGG